MSEEKPAVKTLPTNRQCKICLSEHRDAIESVYFQMRQKHSVKHITEVVRRQFMPDLNYTNLRNHFGLNKRPGTDEYKPAHSGVTVTEKSAREAIEAATTTLVKERAEQVTVEELKLRGRASGMAWLQSISGREHFLEDSVGVKLLALSIDADLKEKALAIKQSQGDKMSAALLGSIGLLGAIFGGRVAVIPTPPPPPKPIDGQVVQTPVGEGTAS